ncbi:MAG TPA: outer membrane beta-barrel protein [Chitinophaga sp.]|uniref:outer membrane beta-barrel protein n=1 Tax=Chitinophaga sp. TaxID=1869181 RepID=UPI002C13D7CF|nr:outer membrane beta-barrel protein [Chitinophaga sp.]HVI43871.1 outer membrane beta-barrel protein [Chitinophaga sp.]
MNQLKSIIITLSLCFTASLLFGQSKDLVISGTVTDGNATPVVAASVSLFRAKDTFLVKITTVDNQGYYRFEGINEDTYFIAVAALGHANYVTSPFSAIAQQPVFTVPPVKLQKQAKELQGVTIKSTRPPVEVRADKMVLNVASSINASGSSALELLKKSPLVKVDNSSNISINNKNGVVVFIDGRQTNLSGSDLAALLQGMQSSNIETIEIITNPSAKFPAEGNAGIINIRMKKNRSYGFNGNATATGTYGSAMRYDAGANLNYRNQAMNIYGNYSYRYGDYNIFSNIFRIEQNGTNNTFDQYTNIVNKSNNHSFKGGADFFLSPKSTLGIMVNGAVNNNPAKNDGLTYIYRVPGKIDSILKARLEQQGNMNRMDYNVNYQYSDTSGRTLNADADYIVYNNDTRVFQPNEYILPDGTSLRSHTIRTTAGTDIRIGTFKVDYEQNLFSGKIGGGLFYNDVTAKNAFKFYDVLTTKDTLNTDRSRVFEYREKVAAAYLTYSRDIKKFNLQAGLRLEHTSASGDLTTYNNTAYKGLDTSYLNLFPSLSIAYNIGDRHTIGISYSQRIDRPGYEDLNPFETPLDELIFARGNPFVRPQYTDNIQLTYNYQGFGAVLGYSRVKDYFTKVIDTLGEGKIMQTIRNIPVQRVYSLNTSLQQPVTKWWNLFLATDFIYTQFKGALNSSILDDNIFTFNAFANNTFSFPNDWSAELSAYYNGPWLQGIMRWKDLWSMDIGVQKKILRGNGAVKLGMTDIFNTNVDRVLINYSGAYSTGRFKGETRQLRLTFDYRFGNSNVKKARGRTTAADAESKRLKG